jgi:dTDP-D-glucose 4,6-dehydratase
VRLECMRTYGIRKFIHVSTDEVQSEINKEDNLLEDALLAPMNSYAASTAATEMIINAYRERKIAPVDVEEVGLDL